MLELAWAIPALPLAGFLLLVLAGRRLGEPAAGWLATVMMAGSFAATLVVFGGLLARDEGERFFEQVLFTWIPAGSFTVDVGFLVDPLSMTMALFITGIATLIHLYSVGYMHGDEHYSKFFIYLNLFAFSMLMLVLGNNMLLTFLGWEGVGACSYLLISFWFTDNANASAGKKAFVTNRIGDWGFMVAMFLTWVSIGSIRWVDVLAESSSLARVTATGIALLLFVGAVGKSAQLPLYVWLPDAMAGPTPVSALIHAATMVTAGVFLMTRANPVLAMAWDWAPSIIAWTGAITALFAATAALAQNDIKKVLAYSTVSQLGYLFLAVGVGGYVPAIFHMITHAFFKALLFLGAGSVIHGLHDEQDMRRMGGLYKLMPITAMTFIVGWLAIAGVPPFSGFWSKDEILAFAYDENIALWLVGLVTAVLTAFYMTRQVVMTFFGRSRYGDAGLAEIQQAWDTKVAEADAGLDQAQAAVTAATEAVDQARNATTAAAKKVDTATAKSADARQAVADAPADTADKARDKLTKAFDKAEKAVTKAVKDAEKVDAGLTKALGAEQGARDALTAAQTEVDQRRAERTTSRPTVENRDVQTPLSAAGVEDYLPDAVAHRREYHPHESPWTMTSPLVVLAGGALVAGVLNLPFSADLHFLEKWLEPSLFANERHLGFGGGTLWVLALIAIAGGLAGIAGGLMVYLRGRADRRRLELPILSRAWAVDEAYAEFVAGPGTKLFEGTAEVDHRVVDGAVNSIAGLVRVLSERTRTIQTGFVRSYALILTVGAVVLVGYLISRASF